MLFLLWISRTCLLKNEINSPSSVIFLKSLVSFLHNETFYLNSSVRFSYNNHPLWKPSFLEKTTKKKRKNLPISLKIKHFFPNDHHYFSDDLFPILFKINQFHSNYAQIFLEILCFFYTKNNELFSENVLNFFLILYLLPGSFMKMEIKPQHNSQTFVALRKNSLFTRPPNSVIHLH